MSVYMDIKQIIEESIAVKKELLSESFLNEINNIGQVLIQALQNGKKILAAGNGGSAADAQHFVAELAGRFMIERDGLPAIALNTNTSVLTAIGNDFTYDQIFAKQIIALGQPGDVFVGITTSGNSKNILEAFKAAKSKGLVSVGLLGKDGGVAKLLCDFSLIVPSLKTQHIQEAHIVLIHTWCALVDAAVAAGIIHPAHIAQDKVPAQFLDETNLYEPKSFISV